MGNQQQEMSSLPQPPRHGLNKQDMEIPQNFCKEHIDEMVEGALDTIPEAIRQFSIKPVLTTRQRVAVIGSYAAVAVVGGIVGGLAYKRLTDRKQRKDTAKVNEEMEKEFSGSTKLRAVGARVS